MVCSILSLLSFLSFHSNFKFLISFQCLICLIFIFSSFRCGLMVCSILSLLGWILVLLSSALHLILALYLGEHHLISDQIFSRYLAGETNPENKYWWKSLANIYWWNNFENEYWWTKVSNQISLSLASHLISDQHLRFSVDYWLMKPINKIGEQKSRTRSRSHWLLIGLLFPSHQHLCYRGHYLLEVTIHMIFINRNDLLGWCHYFLAQLHDDHLDPGGWEFHQVTFQVAGSGNKGIVTSVFNCQLTTGLLFINMVWLFIRIVNTVGLSQLLQVLEIQIADNIFGKNLYNICQFV